MMVKEKTMQKEDNRMEMQKNIDNLFIRGARDGKLWLVKRLKGIISSINVKDGYGKTALEYSKEHGHTDVSEYIDSLRMPIA